MFLRCSYVCFLSYFAQKVPLEYLCFQTPKVQIPSIICIVNPFFFIKIRSFCWFELENNHLRTRPFLRFEAFLSLACLPFPQDVFLSIHLTIILPLKLSFADNVTTLFQLNLDVFHYLYKLVFQISDPCELHIFFQSLFLWVIGKSTSPHMKEKRWYHLKVWKRHPERRSR